jgi:hypothetical protein
MVLSACNWHDRNERTPSLELTTRRMTRGPRPRCNIKRLSDVHHVG